MNLLEIRILPIVLTLGAFRIGQLCQQKWKKPIFNPTLIAAVLMAGLLLVTGTDSREYGNAMGALSWLMTPATIALAIPMYEQFQTLKKHLWAIAAAVAAGAVASLGLIALLGLGLGMEQHLLMSLLPKSVTTAIGVPLSQLFGGLGGVTTAAIIITGILANMMGPWLCKRLGITHPVAQGVALGTSGHVIGTARATEMGPLVGAVSSLSLVTAGLLTSVVMPLVVSLIP